MERMKSMNDKFIINFSQNIISIISININQIFSTQYQYIK